MSGHWPGPWAVTRRGGRFAGCVADPSRPRGEHDTEDSFKFYGGDLVAESIAPENLDIIAAAPEMYAALRDLIHSDGPSGESWARAEAAVAKAEGKAQS